MIVMCNSIKSSKITMADVLELAADDVLVHGLRKGSFGVKGGSRCALGHLLSHTITEGDCGNYDELTLYYDIANELAKHLGGGVHTWSDDSATTAGDVREAFLLTAKDLRNESNHR